MTTPQLDDKEKLVWTILRRLEELAWKQYSAFVPALALDEKKQIVNLLSAQVPDDEAFAGSDLSDAVDELVAAANGHDAAATLIMQGFLLEPLGQAIYGALADNETASAATHEMARAGQGACSAVIKKVPGLLESTIGRGEVLYDVFATNSRGLLLSLDALGEGIDAALSERFNLTFAFLMGEFAAELLPSCVDLGMTRRKVICHLTGALMGI